MANSGLKGQWPSALRMQGPDRKDKPMYLVGKILYKKEEGPTPRPNVTQGFQTPVTARIAHE
jgi:hypothetical protein